MSDLYCAARLVLATAGGGTSALADSLAGRRVSSVYAGPDPRAEGAERVAGALGVRLVASPDLGAAESGEAHADVVERHRRRLEEIADLHRGETVLVLVDAAALALVVPSLVGPVPDLDDVVELENDADGWVRA